MPWVRNYKEVARYSDSYKGGDMIVCLCEFDMPDTLSRIKRTAQSRYDLLNDYLKTIAAVKSLFAEHELAKGDLRLAVQVMVLSRKIIAEFNSYRNTLVDCLSEVTKILNNECSDPKRCCIYVGSKDKFDQMKKSFNEIASFTPDSMKSPIFGDSSCDKLEDVRRHKPVGLFATQVDAYMNRLTQIEEYCIPLRDTYALLSDFCDKENHYAYNY